MKLVTAIVRPFKVDEIRRSLSSLGIRGMTATEVRGFGRQRGHTEFYRGNEYQIDLLPKVRLEVVCEDGHVDPVLAVLAAAARSGKVGDGKIFVYDVAEAIRIRNDERGEMAL